ncbi:MAG: phosphoglycerate kinase [Chloroflexi bacterium RBG_16_51_9]|nr:MAG: phosphoglycerate kinase [Chloroflexi bacterium RBG_16_51_9]
MEKLTIRDIDVSGKRVLVRVDFNVPLDEKTQVIGDDSRIRAAIPTIQYLTGHGARVILCSHLGRPDGKVIESQRMGVTGRRLSELLGKPVKIAKDCIGPEVEKAVAGLKNGDVLLLENLRFYAEEEENGADFAKALAGLAEIYVDDAFGTAHRKHASIVGVTKYLPSVAGFLMEQELQHLGGIVENPAHPFGGLFGGAKVSDKVALLESIMGKVNFLFIGGGMAATFLKVKSIEVGKSLIEEDRFETAAKLMGMAKKNGVELLLPVDVVVATEIKPEAKGVTVPVEKIGQTQRIVDIGPRTIENFSAKLRQCKAVFWNGTMGIAEIPQFAQGTLAMGKLLAGLKATTVIGGGSTSEAVTNMGLADKMTFVSTGGGASLMLLGGQKLPGVEALLDKK